MPIAPHLEVGHHEPLIRLCWGFVWLDFHQSYIHKGWGKGTSLHANDAVFLCPGAQPNRVALLRFLFYALFCSITHTCYPHAWQAQQNQRDYIVSIWKYSTIITEQALSPSPSPSYNKQVKHEREKTWRAHLEPAPSKGASWLTGIQCSKGG